MGLILMKKAKFCYFFIKKTSKPANLGEFLKILCQQIGIFLYYKMVSKLLTKLLLYNIF